MPSEAHQLIAINRCAEGGALSEEVVKEFYYFIGAVLCCLRVGMCVCYLSDFDSMEVLYFVGIRNLILYKL